jgi:CHASE1-domain containing sensor protein
MIFKNYSLFFQAIALTSCLALSYLSFALVHRLAQFRSDESFAALTDQSLASLDRRLDDFRRTLDGVAGLIIASDQVTAEEMASYGEALQISDDTSGIDAIGYAESNSIINSPAGDIFEPYRGGHTITSPQQPQGNRVWN